ncbi:uncharacterized protein LOC129238592 [Anastrepha obliqua]|uniref:uncharacterized protein LOC129238592 n=1 Tax=Anastrepha obliqua TaxID=95512 RepID=UPI002409F221|nr:uncharacterized protein LOC129238592 [Anastrepha obliqua]
MSCPLNNHYIDNNLNWLTLEEIAKTLRIVVNKTIHTAVELILSDVKGEFYYPDPKLEPQTRTLYPDFLQFHAEYKEKHVNWINIQDFSVNEIFSQVRDYINLWHLSDCTKYTLGINDKTNVIPGKGSKYFLDAIFSKPTPICPNPLAVAKVLFTVTVPELLPKYYPVKVIYRFESYRTPYHAFGRFEVHSKDFQRYFIDSILQKKLVFYAKIFECRHPQIKLKEDENDEEEEEGEAEDDDKTREYEADKSGQITAVNSSDE